MDLQIIEQIAKKAGTEALKIYNQNFSIEYKDDNSPLTDADKASNEIICNELVKISNYPILSEENKIISYKERKKWNYYWCIDPIDGTKEFIKKNGEWTVNIALIHKDSPVLGVVYAPAIDIIYSATKGIGVFRNGEKIKLTNNNRNNRKLRVVASRSHLNKETQKFIDKLRENYNIELISKGSSLKLCMVADGSADIYPRLSPTMEWDTAAADAIVREAGKMTYIYNKNFSFDSNSLKPLVYNKENLLNPCFIVF